MLWKLHQYIHKIGTFLLYLKHIWKDKPFFLFFLSELCFFLSVAASSLSIHTSTNQTPAAPKCITFSRHVGHD